MAKKQITSFVRKPKARRKGIHAKTKVSKSKTSKLYRKRYAGQGR